jgi:hypothetical protein
VVIEPSPIAVEHSTKMILSALVRNEIKNNLAQFAARLNNGVKIH